MADLRSCMHGAFIAAHAGEIVVTPPPTTPPVTTAMESKRDVFKALLTEWRTDQDEFCTNYLEKANADEQQERWRERYETACGGRWTISDVLAVLDGSGITITSRRQVSETLHARGLTWLTRLDVCERGYGGA